MELLQLKYFQTVATMENITQAAEVLYISQPSLSRAITRLEKDLGVPLFDRKGKNIYLNQYGKAFLKHVDTILQELETSRQELKDMASPFSGMVTIGAVTSRFLPHLFHQYLQLHPDIKFRLVHLHTHSKSEEQLLSGNVDLAFTCLPINRSEIQCRHIYTEEILLAVSTKHPLSKKSHIMLSEVADEPFISLSTTADFDISNMFSNFYSQAGFVPKIRFECPTADVIANLVAENFGCALFAESWANTVPVDDIVFLHIHSPICSRKLYLSCTNYQFHSQAVNDFYQFVIEQFSITSDTE